MKLKTIFNTSFILPLFLRQQQVLLSQNDVMCNQKR
jgi:hypothetical protein